MKKLLLLLVVMLLPLAASAETVEIDGIMYNLISKTKTAEVTKKDIYYGSVIIPESVTYESINYSVTSIGESAFFGCTSLTSVSIPYSVTSIGGSAFGYCPGLTSVHITNLEAWCKILFTSSESNPLSYAHRLYLNGEIIKDLIIPNSITSIGEYTFIGSSCLTSVTIPNSVTNISNYAFGGCSSLTSVTIPNSVTSIGNYAFSGCSGLTSITIPNSVTSIGDGAFGGCSGLTSVTIPNSVTYIAYGGFSECSGLTSVTIPNSVTIIGIGAFYKCSGLTSITIGNSVTRIGARAFNGCSELTDVICYAKNVPNTERDAFENSYIEYATLHVPLASVNAYKDVTPWKNFKEVVALDGETPETSKCEKPTISYANGQLKMSCATEGVEYVTDITDTDVKKHYSAAISLTATYNISVYATKSGYDNSDVATATLCWIDATPQTEGITDGVSQIAARPVLIKTDNGFMTVEGVDDRTNIRIFTTDGKQVGSAISQNNVATVATSLQPGSIAIVKVGGNSVKVVIH